MKYSLLRHRTTAGTGAWPMPDLESVKPGGSLPRRQSVNFSRIGEPVSQGPQSPGHRVDVLCHPEHRLRGDGRRITPHFSDLICSPGSRISRQTAADSPDR